MDEASDDLSQFLMSPDRVGAGVFMAIEYFDTQFFPLRPSFKFTLSAILSVLAPFLGLLLSAMAGHEAVTFETAKGAAGLGFAASQVIHKLFENAAKKGAAKANQVAEVAQVAELAGVQEPAVSAVVSDGTAASPSDSQPIPAITQPIPQAPQEAGEGKDPARNMSMSAAGWTTYTVAMRPPVGTQVGTQMQGGQYGWN